jgi:hypothetical protein
MSPEDAHVLGRHVAPEVSEHDLAHLGAYTATARLVVDGEETPAFTLRTRPAPAPIPGRAQAVRDANRAAHHRRPDAKTARPVLAGRALPAIPQAAPPPRREVPIGDVPAGGVRSGVRQGVHGGLRHGLRPGMEPSGPEEPAGQGGAEGSDASADSRGRWS